MLKHSSLKIIFKNNKKIYTFNVSAPFHCSLMRPAANKMKEKLIQLTFKKPNFDIICNVTSQPENQPEKIKDF